MKLPQQYSVPKVRWASAPPTMHAVPRSLLLLCMLGEAVLAVSFASGGEFLNSLIGPDPVLSSIRLDFAGLCIRPLANAVVVVNAKIKRNAKLLFMANCKWILAREDSLASCGCKRPHPKLVKFTEFPNSALTCHWDFLVEFFGVISSPHISTNCC